MYIESDTATLTAAEVPPGVLVVHRNTGTNIITYWWNDRGTVKGVSIA